uniref:Uncharacterized protein n=1 Tax=Anguilla anguilla TaxID=7936 RepID=A0A0E9S6K0_ANGAN
MHTVQYLAHPFLAECQFWSNMYPDVLYNR